MSKGRYLVISDIHSNIEALESVLRAVARRSYESVLCMGDLVGYGASPNPVVRRLRRLKSFVAVRGNHDRVCSGADNGHQFNVAARQAAEWTLRHLSPDNRSFLRCLPQGPLEAAPGVWIAHGSIPDEDAYLFSDFDAYRVFESHPFRVCFFGHTHFPMAFRQGPAGIDMLRLDGDEAELILEPGHRYLINPGSVGQPRDRNPRAAFAEFTPSSGRLTVRRVGYDVAAAAGRIRKAKLPEALANRLVLGA